MWLNFKQCDLTHFSSLSFSNVPFSLFSKILSVQLYTGMPALPSRSVGGGWPLYDALLRCTDSPNWKNLLKSPHSQPGRSASRRGHRAAEFPLKLSFSLSFVIHLPLPLFLSFSYHLSLSFLCLPLFILPPFLVFILYSVSLCSPSWIFLFMRALGFALLSAISACRGESRCGNWSILSVWQTSGITVTSSNECWFAAATFKQFESG